MALDKCFRIHGKNEKCEICGKCKCFCSCIRCPICSNRFAYNVVCNRCYFCIECCKCPNVTFFKNNLRFYKSTAKQRMINKSQRFIAAEIEVASISKKGGKEIMDMVKKWNGNIVRDSSLPESGFEINTSPANGDIFINQVNEICDVLNKGEATICNDCGTHIHIDARDYNYFDIEKLLKIYSRVEPMLFEMVPKSRRKADHCKPTTDRYMSVIKNNNQSFKELKHNIVNSLYGEPSTMLRYERRNNVNQRRFAMNIHSFLYRGTIECRLLNGSINAEEIVKWGRLWLYIVDFGLNVNMDKLDIISSMPDYEAMINVINNDQEIKNFIDERREKWK